MTDWSLDDFEAAGVALVRRLAAYVETSASGAGPVVRIRPVAEVARDLDLAGCLRRGALTPASFEKLAAAYLENSTRLHHPGYLAHQVAVPDFPAALADLASGVMNNGMAVYEMGPAAVAVELTVLDWMLGKLGWPAARWPGEDRPGPRGAGVLTHGGSLANLTALLAARARVAPEAWEAGVPGDLAVLAPPTSHYSIARAVSIMGLGSRALFPLEVDERDVIRPERLPAALAAVQEAGRRPLALVANACSTATGLFDPLEPVAAFCREHDLWLHVDACHGASARLSAGEAGRLDGIETADSAVWDAHKMLRTSGLCAAVLFRDEAAFDRAFRQQASYLFYGRQEAGVDLIHRTVECTKMPLGLKLFLNLAWHGEDSLGAYWDDRLAVTRRFAAALRARPGFSCPYEPESNILCFRHDHGQPDDGDERQIAIRQALLEAGDFHLSSAEVGGRRHLRVVVMSPATTDTDLERLLDAVERAATAV